MTTTATEANNYKLLINQHGAVEVYFNSKPNAATITALKQHHFKYFFKLKCWSSFKTIEETTAILNGLEIQTDATGSKEKTAMNELKQDKEILAAYLKEYQKIDSSDSMLDYEKKSTSYVIKLDNGGFMQFEKPSIETRFCFGYGYCGISSDEEQKDASSMAAHARTSEEYFKNENLRNIEDQIKAVEESNKLYLSKKYYDETANIYYYTTEKWYNREYFNGFDMSKYTEATDSDKQQILKVLKNEKVKFEKRLNTYLKRYGLSKIHSWTYLSD